MNRKKIKIMMVIIIVLSVASVFVFKDKDEEPDLSLLNIDHFLVSMAQIDQMIVETEENGVLKIVPNKDFLDLFHQKEWKRIKLDSSLESIPTIKLMQNDDYYLQLSAFDNYAMIYFADSSEKYRYYKIPDGIVETIQAYILEHGKPMKETYTEQEEQTNTYIGFISDFAQSHPNRFQFDPVEWITLDDKERIEALQIKERDMPNGYYIYNPEIEKMSFEVDEATEYQFIDWNNDFVALDEDRFYRTKEKEEFIQYLHTYSDQAAKVPFWIEAKGNHVVRITEQYVP